MSKTFFAIANQFFLDEKYEQAFVIYDFLVEEEKSLGKEFFEAYTFNKNLCLNQSDINLKCYSSNRNIEILVLRVVEALYAYDADAAFYIKYLETNYLKSVKKYFDIIDEDFTLFKFYESFKFFNTNLYAIKNRINCDGLIDYYQKYKLPQGPLSLKFSVEEMKKKLWGGFSNEVVELIKNSLSSGKYDKKSKAQSALVLGKWYAVKEDWDLAVKYIKLIKNFDESLFRRKRIKLLLIQSLINNEDYSSAYSMIEYALNKEFDSDYICAKINYEIAQAKSKDEEYLNLLNSIYLQNNLLPVQMDLKNGYKFGAWTYKVPKDKWVSKGPKISILMPVYGAEEYIEVAIHSMLSQTWRNIEIIAVEDCSPDKSWEKLQQLAKTDSRLKIFKNDVNLGAYPTRNKALSLATGEFVTVHDSDDWSHPQMLEKQMEVLLATGDNIKATCSYMARVYPDLSFILRPSRENLEYVHRSYPSVLIRRADVSVLGQWDSTSANADDEFIQRIRILWGAESIVDVMPNVPFSLFLVHPNSLTQQKGTSLNSLTFGIRKTYADQAAYWRKTRANLDTDLLKVKRNSFKSPFPIPTNLAPKNWEKNKKYDVVIISDLSLLGGTRRCNEAYISVAAESGLRVGLFHWARFDLKVANIADEYYELCYKDNVDLLVPEDEISAQLVLIHHPPILKYEIDAIPKIETNNVKILVNQSPMQRWSQKSFYYDPQSVERLCLKLFNTKPQWIPISGRVQQILEITGGYQQYPEIWSPPYSDIVDMENYDLPVGFGSNREIIIGRHARDHWTKWPQTLEVLNEAYCLEKSDIKVRILGGFDGPLKILGHIPHNVEVLEFDSVNVRHFIESLDFFLHFVNEDYIEEFGRNVMEAMALGRVVILPYEFKEIFADAAIYCEPHEVAQICKQYWDNPDMYLQQIKKGKVFVSEHCSNTVIKQRLLNAL